MQDTDMHGADLAAGTWLPRPARKVSWRGCRAEGAVKRGAPRTALGVSRGACMAGGLRSSDDGAAGGVAGLSLSGRALPGGGSVLTWATPANACISSDNKD
jgi:hypothetical protein